MAFLSTKIVPSGSGCISKSSSPPATDQIVFNSLEQIMAFTWKAGLIGFDVSGSLTSVLTFPGGTDTIILECLDSGPATSTTEIIPPPTNMSSYLCSGRISFAQTFSTNINFTQIVPPSPPDTATLSGSIQVNGIINYDDSSTNIFYYIADDESESYWIQGLQILSLILGISSAGSFEDAGTITWKGQEIGKFKYTNAPFSAPPIIETRSGAINLELSEGTQNLAQ